MFGIPKVPLNRPITMGGVHLSEKSAALQPTNDVLTAGSADRPFAAQHPSSWSHLFGR